MKTIAVVGLLLLLIACGTAPKKDGAGKQFDLSKVKPVVPTNEPKSKGGNPPSYVVFGQRYFVMPSAQGYVEEGIASWYGSKFHGNKTSNGEIYDMYQFTAAHKSLPLPTFVEVTNLANNRKIILRVNDRGPFHENRIIDLSYAAALKLDIVKNGTGRVRVRAITDPKAATTSAAPTSSISQDPALVGGQLFTQVGAFSQLSNAQALQSELIAKQFKYVNIYPDKTLGIYRLRLGPHANTSVAAHVLKTLKQQGFSEAKTIVVDKNSR